MKKTFLPITLLFVISFLKVDASVPLPDGTATYGSDPFWENLEYYIAPIPNAPIIIFVHGGGWRTGSREDSQNRTLCGLLRDVGYAVVNINYTLDGATSYTGYPLQPLELDTAILWTKGHASLFRGDTTRMILSGHSAGGHLVTLHALKNTNPRLNVKGVMSTSGVYDFNTVNPQRLVDVYYMLRDTSYYDDAQPINHVSASTNTKFLCINGKGDLFLGHQQYITFNNAMRANNQCILFHFVPGNHALLDNLTDTSLVFRLMKNFLDSLGMQRICTPTTCGTPTNLTTTNITSTSADLQWNAVNGAQYYNVQYKKSNSTTILNVYPIDASVRLLNLTPNSNYRWKVKSYCVTSPGTFSNEVSFRTLPGRFAKSVTDNRKGIADLMIYPNPASNIVILQFNSYHAANFRVNMYDFLGRIVFNQKNGFDDGFNNISINTANLQDGIYLVEIRDGEQTIQRKLTISK